jgi:protein-disulfide isomerase
VNRRIAVQITVGAVVLVIAAVVIALVVSHQHAASAKVASSSQLGPKNMASGGVLLAGQDGQVVTVRTPAVAIGHPVATKVAAEAKTVNIVEYIDYQCPACLAFEETNLSNTAKLVAAGAVTLEIHPIAFLDRSSEGTRYSSRADNAAACVANFEPDLFLKATAALYEYQPKEGTTGLTNAQLLAVLGKASVKSAAITKCVDNETFKDWVTATTSSVESGTFAQVATTPVSFQGTPTVFVNGVQYTGSITAAAPFVAFLDTQSKG